MVKHYLSICLVLFCFATNAVPTMGTTTLFYGESIAVDSLLSHNTLSSNSKQSTESKIDIRQVVLTEIVKQIPGFQSLLNNALTESNVFNVYDANKTILSWKNADPQLLDTYYKTTKVEMAPHTESANHSVHSENIIIESALALVPNTKESHPARQFIVLGFVDSIHEHETRTPVAGTSKTVLLYNLDIRCEYRLINPSTKKVVAVFTAAGHGGLARILGNGQIPLSYDLHAIVSDMFYSLSENINHDLLLREDQYIKKRISDQKIEMQQTAPK